MKEKPRFHFGNIVVVDDDKIGVILKTYESSLTGFNYDVYVRSYDHIDTYFECNINHYVYSKELSEDEKEFYR